MKKHIITLTALLTAHTLCAQNDYLPAEILLQHSSTLDVTAPPFNAVPNDGKDDTAAIQAAFDAARTRLNAEKSSAYSPSFHVYLPAGVYEISKPLIYTDNERDGRFNLVGDGADKTILRLVPNAPDFQDAENPKAVVTFLDSNRIPTGGMSFQNHCRDLTIEVGAGNPGAVGLDFYNNNTGGARNVTIRSLDPKGTGYAGFAVPRRKAGVAYHVNLRVEGFDYGISGFVPGITEGDNAHLFENVFLTGQKKAGVQVGDKRMSFIDLRSENSVPAFLINHRGAGVNLLSSELLGGAPDQPAVELQVGGFHAEGVTIEGYGMAVRNQQKAVEADLGKYFLMRTNRSGKPLEASVNMHGTSNAREVDLPLDVPAPSITWPSKDDIYIIQSPTNQKLLDVEAYLQVQQSFSDAFASGKSTIVVMPGYYQFNKGIEIPPHVTRINAWMASLRQRPPLAENKEEATLTILPRKNPLIISNAWISGGTSPGIRDLSGSDVILDGVQLHKNRDTVYKSKGGGRLWLLNSASRHMSTTYGEETEPSWIFGPGQQVFGRVFNPEQQDSGHVLVDGASLANIGGKVGEKFGPYYVVRNGGKVRTIGQWINANDKLPPPPRRAVAEVDADSQFSMVGMYFTEPRLPMPLMLSQAGKALPFEPIIAGETGGFWLPLISTIGEAEGEKWVEPIAVKDLPEATPPPPLPTTDNPQAEVTPESIGALADEARILRYDFDQQVPGSWKVQTRTFSYEAEDELTFGRLKNGAVSTLIPIPESSQLRVTGRMSLADFTPVEKRFQEAGVRIIFYDEKGIEKGPKYNYVKLNENIPDFREITETFIIGPEVRSAKLVLQIPNKQEADLRVDWIEIEAIK